MLRGLKKAVLIGVPITVAVVSVCDVSSLPFLPVELRFGMASLPWFNHRHSDFQPVSPGQLQGKVAVVTGGNSGIGLETAKTLAMGGATVVLTSRDFIRGEEARQRILSAVPGANVRAVLLDLADLHSIGQFTEEFAKLGLRQLDILVLNAGSYSPTTKITKQGFESAFGSHHIGHFYLFKQLSGLLANSTSPRVVITSSALMGKVQHIDYSTVRPASKGAHHVDAGQLYAQSKFANILFARELQKRYPMITVSVNTPGLVRTKLLGEDNFCDRLQLLGVCFEAAEGAKPNILGCVGAPQAVRDHFVLPRGVLVDWKDVPANCQDAKQAEELWSWTEEAIAHALSGK